jgi:lipoprotein-releasing system ATP-binding protein
MGDTTVKVLKGIDLDVHAGQILAVVGQSGAGKSTLLHILGTLDQPTRGALELDGVDVFTFNERELARFRNHEVGFVFQFHHLLPEFSALENVMMPGMIARRPLAALRYRAQDLLNDVGLLHRMDHRPGELSGGEMQRVAVARALLMDPKIVLADEPSGNLDLATSKALHDLLWQLSRRDKRTFIIVTHNLALAEDADRVIEIADGQIVRERSNQLV